MGKSMTKDQRKNNKYIFRDQDRKNKYNELIDIENTPAKSAKPKKKWQPHAEIEVN